MSQCRLAIELRTCFLSRGESTRGTHAVESVGRCLGAGLKPRFNNDQGDVPRAASSGEARQWVESRPFNPTSFTAFPPLALALAICFSYRYPIPHSPPLLILSSWRSGELCSIGYAFPSTNKIVCVPWPPCRCVLQQHTGLEIKPEETVKDNPGEEQICASFSGVKRAHIR
ncbi:hypothetical protein MUK42_03465 [Musa troglodytarum]|uniref:Uncharacterized protein n=1 Tax=Musa troglodytarum TaxID=320322 RepID=A0A9E7KPH0_9LILI|nr:hypothetical protein MUK42_03465 [Musa troglodytarum]URE23167.1 hypothetical protein MUK42_03465 [Musa troglodytarum]